MPFDNENMSNIVSYRDVLKIISRSISMYSCRDAFNPRYYESVPRETFSCSEFDLEQL